MAKRGKKKQPKISLTRGLSILRIGEIYIHYKRKRWFINLRFSIMWKEILIWPGTTTFWKQNPNTNLMYQSMIRFEWLMFRISLITEWTPNLKKITRELEKSSAKVFRYRSEKGKILQALSRIQQAEPGDEISTDFVGIYKKSKNDVFIKCHPCTGTFTEPDCERYSEEELINLLLDKVKLLS